MRLRTIFKRKDPKDGSDLLAAGGSQDTPVATVAEALGAVNLNGSPIAPRDSGTLPRGPNSISLDR